MSTAQAALNVFYYFQKQELKLSFNTPHQAALYQNLNREARIFASEPTATFLPLSPSMSYLRDSSKGLVIGFSRTEDADRWRQSSILGQKHGPYEVHIGRGWTDEQLNQVLQPPDNLFPTSDYMRPLTAGSDSSSVRDQGSSSTSTPLPPALLSGPKRHSMPSPTRPVVSSSSSAPHPPALISGSSRHAAVPSATRPVISSSSSAPQLTGAPAHYTALPGQLYGASNQTAAATHDPSSGLVPAALRAPLPHVSGSGPGNRFTFSY
ncbi:hypothetical protein BDV29DRAFT_178657 [Aspergillus leporis]|jgi:hypothetical protein|uniref:Uncharacterized protein n=1 Tax=Aspergillus leporis TaxID=41062 RepID=A0A5N5WX56_9EURO|nr:hypothetical protein BDV29DRAFT_178657 [Aspergillus leporis]